MEKILYRLSNAIHSAINGTQDQREFIPHALHDLIKLEIRPACLTEIVYDWCSMILKNRQSLGNWEDLLFVSLEIGFRHLDFQKWCIEDKLTYTEHHLEMVDVVFKSRKGETIADLLHAWTIANCSVRLLVGTLTEHLVGVHNIVPLSSRLRRLVIRSVELIGYEGFEGVGVERFVVLLDHLRVTVKDMDNRRRWVKLLLETLQTPEGAQHLSHWYLELLVELAISLSLWPKHEISYNPQIVTFLAEARDWSKLECWVGIFWMVWPPGVDGMAEEDLGHLMLLLFRRRPGAFQKLEQWMERWSRRRKKDIPESFRRICKQAQEATQQDTP